MGEARPKLFCKCCQCNRDGTMVLNPSHRRTSPAVLAPEGWIEAYVRPPAVGGALVYSVVVRICPRCQRRTANYRAVQRADAMAAGLPWPPPRSSTISEKS